MAEMTKFYVNGNLTCARYKYFIIDTHACDLQICDIEEMQCALVRLPMYLHLFIACYTLQMTSRQKATAKQSLDRSDRANLPIT